ncbi:DUF320-domain-containing protein [Conidiobolus coronatus NRRL 28638]|uniref:DUF320-domain-containing protein n=1 Tax=Conidiobolus coronatus (strain ATCC 28846 / CBS 209.66 / NRRL 28638) TaxID=796925 RepID=A0A137NPK2_CONC2|nr:DUF320-domain-containing protein [Conidiobolus coronatus NRRL 28638]|eukprot:KXN64664.1 DUF320-domain-containing protein [Conidiobolus coronatus NRRL 28638]
MPTTSIELPQRLMGATTGTWTTFPESKPGDLVAPIVSIGDPRANWIKADKKKLYPLTIAYILFLYSNMKLLILSVLLQFTLGSPIDSIGASVSPGLLSGNVIQLPLDIPINACGNSINVVGALNPTFGNECFNFIENA